MTITVDIPPEIEQLFVAQAQARGLSLDAYASECLANSAKLPLLPSPRSTDELNLLFDEAADMIPIGTPPLSDEAMSRESIYTREDEW